jgi:hypothetical protein
VTELGIDEVTEDISELEDATELVIDELAVEQTPAAAGCNPKCSLCWNSQRVSSII